MTKEKTLLPRHGVLAISRFELGSLHLLQKRGGLLSNRQEAAVAMLVHETEGHDDPLCHHDIHQHFELGEILLPLLSFGIEDRYYVAPDAVLCALVLLVITFLWWHGACAGSALGNVPR